MTVSAQELLNTLDVGAAAQLIARIRAVEEQLLTLFSQGRISGTTHTSIGQEVCAAGLFPHVDQDRDIIFSSHRCHGHFIAYGGPIRGLLAEIMGKQGGVCRGRGGSQHLCYRGFFSNGIVGGGVPIATGVAHRLKSAGRGGMCVSIIGDGALGQGVVYESLNIASLLSVPLLLVVEYNGCAQSTDTSTTTAGDVVERIKGFGVAVDRCKADDPVDLARHYQEVVEYTRAGHPFVQIVDTFRLMAHSKGDDLRSVAVLEQARQSDYFERQLASGNRVFVQAWESARQEVAAISAELENAEDEVLTAFSALPPRVHPMFASSAELVFQPHDAAATLRVNELLNRGLATAMERDSSVMLIGEDLMDPYGGAFKVAKGLSSAFPAQVFSSPISEASITGFSNGIALAGGRPVVEIMFGDFSTLAMDQMINHAAKFHFMYAGQVSPALTMRLVSGGYRGYGATHSQSMEGYFCKAPGLRVVALSARHRPDTLISQVILDANSPTVFVENKLLYSKRPSVSPPVGFRFIDRPAASPSDIPALQYTSVEAGTVADITVVTYGGLTEAVEAEMEDLLLNEEIDFDYFVLTQLSPLDVTDIAESVRRTGCLLTVEEGPVHFGIGAEVISGVGELVPDLVVRARRVGAKSVPIPSSSLQERSALPSGQDVRNAVLDLL